MGSSEQQLLINGIKPMGVTPSGLVSNSLTWEKVYTKNIGLDLNFFNNRLTFSGDIYRRDTKDMLTKGKTLPSVLGALEPRINAADMKTEVWGISLLAIMSNLSCQTIVLLLLGLIILLVIWTIGMKAVR